jgi:hypothetical protein
VITPANADKYGLGLWTSLGITTVPKGAGSYTCYVTVQRIT